MLEGLRLIGMNQKKIIDTNGRTISKIGIVAPSFFVEKHNNFINGIKELKSYCDAIVYGKTVNNRVYNTTGTAKERAEDINSMFSDPDIDMIIASDGGCRAIEVLEYLDYEMIEKNSKIICGFSDITHILLAIYAKTSNRVIHGMDVINGFGEGLYIKQNIDLFWKNVETDQWNMGLSKAKILKEGSGCGVTIGGWLNAIVNLSGTEYFPKDNKIILFWETIDEEPNRINMMLQALRLSNLLNRVEGMIIGELTNCVEKEYYDCIPTIEDIILKACDGYDFPIIMNAPFGHKEHKGTIPYGLKVIINTKRIPLIS